MNRVLMIDDDIEVLEINKKFMEEKGLKVEICGNAKDGENAIELFNPDCILLDVMMPDTDGITFCKFIRAKSDVPILFLSGKISEEDKLDAFEAGADDYIEKPYGLRELYARILVHIKRKEKKNSSKYENMIIDLSPFYIDKEKHKLFYNDDEIPLSNKEYDLILFLAQNANKDISFSEIGKKLWGTYIENDRRNVMVNVSRLRKKIEAQTGIDNLIETVWSKGYKLVKK